MKKNDFETRMREIDKRYSEYFAQALLALSYDRNFVNSKTDECPDIQLQQAGDNQGVEVTRFICSYYKTLKRYAKAWANKGLSIEQIAKSLPDELKNSIGLSQDYKVIPLKSLGGNTSITKTKAKFAEILDTKLDRFQKYRKFDKNSLFIFATELNKDFSSRQMLSAFINQSHLKTAEQKFDNIMVFTFDKLVIFDLNRFDNVYDEIVVEQDTIDFCDKYARRKIHNPNITLKNYLRNNQIDLEEKQRQ